MLHNNLKKPRITNPARNSCVSRLHSKASRFTGYALLLLLPLLIIPQPTTGQEIQFGSFADYQILLEDVTMGDLRFEGPVVVNGGTFEIDLSESYILEIVGVRYLDAGVSIQGDGELFLDGDPNHAGDPEKTINFTLKAAYTNSEQVNESDAKLITIASGSSNIGDVRFPILARSQAPPGPPPIPPTGQFDQSEVEESAFIYLYGEIDVGDVHVGEYSGNITIYIQYDVPPELVDE